MKFPLLLVSLLTGMFLQAQSLSVIGNPNGVPNEIAQAKFNSVFKGETKTWDNGTRIKLALMRSTTETGKQTCSKVYQMGCDDVTKFWLRKAMEANTLAPVFFNTVGELQAFVAANPGAIGIIDLSAPAGGTHSVTIDGKRAF